MSFTIQWFVFTSILKQYNHSILRLRSVAARIRTSNIPFAKINNKSMFSGYNKSVCLLYYVKDYWKLTLTIRQTRIKYIVHFIVNKTGEQHSCFQHYQTFTINHMRSYRMHPGPFWRRTGFWSLIKTDFISILLLLKHILFCKDCLLLGTISWN